MRNFELPGRSEAFGQNGMAATSHPLATVAALDVLKAGGNAVDAAITAAGVLAVVEPTQTGIGGDCFALIKKRNAPIVAINGSGAAPASISLDYFLERGISSIDATSPHSVTVPGALRAWAALSKDHGTWDWARLLQPAIHAARSGHPVTERLARDWALQLGKLRSNAAAAETFLPDGDPPGPGYVHYQPRLSKALEAIAADGADAFYQGWIADDIVSTLKALGGFHELSDFADCKAEYVEAIATDYRGYELWQCPPNGQGIVVLAMARLLERYDLSSLDPLGVERLHLLAEAARISYAERDFYVCDPAFAQVPTDTLLSDERVEELTRQIDISRRSAYGSPFHAKAHNHTTYISIVDKDRTAVSFINSIFDDFGSGIVTPKSGIVLHNRGCGFVLEAGHCNSIAGGKRPMHTIIPAMLMKNQEAVMPFGVTGGHFQPIGQIQILTNLIDFNFNLQEAIDQPRMFARSDIFEVEGAVPQKAVEALRALGHPVAPASNPLGTAQAIWIDEATGLLRGGADPRRDGIALGY